MFPYLSQLHSWLSCLFVEKLKVVMKNFVQGLRTWNEVVLQRDRRVTERVGERSWLVCGEVGQAGHVCVGGQSASNNEESEKFKSLLQICSDA